MTGERDQRSDRAAGRRAIRRLLRAFYSRDSYGLVTAMIVGTYVVALLGNGPWTATVLVFAQILTVWQVTRVSRAGRRFRRWTDVVFALAVLAAAEPLFARDNGRLVAVVFAANSILYLVAPVAIVRHIVYRRDVDRETMLGALSAYLLLGMAFAFVYRCLAAWQSGPFFGPAGDGALSQHLFFSFVTLTTTGYGNLVPAGNPGQSIAVIEALLGQLFLVTAVAKIVDAWRPRGWRQPARADADGAESPRPT
jgi:Ion channel